MTTSESPVLDWRSKIIESLVNLHIGMPGSRLYGVEHALAVEEAALASVTGSMINIYPASDLTVLRCAALLHDVGFSQRDEAWAVDGFEHLVAGQRLATEILYTIPALRSDAEKIARILSLVAHHDDTVYAFPATTNGNCSRSVKWPLSNSGADKLLLILREADSFIHAGAACVAEATHEWEASGIPLVTARGAPLATWRWMDSIVGNLRLLAKRALVDACSLNGETAALEAYSRIEQTIRERCQASGVAYEPEICPPTMRRDSLARLAGRTFDLQLNAFHNWRELEDTLRSVPLIYDRTLHPYRAAELKLAAVRLEALTPMALYILRKRVDEVIELHDALMVAYALGIWDLPGLLRFRYNSDDLQWIAPPLVEDYVETMWPGTPRILGLVDGLHRCTAAREIGLQQVHAIVAAKCTLSPGAIAGSLGRCHEVRDR